MSDFNIETYLASQFENIGQRFDALDDKMKTLESDVKKIELQGSETKERLVRLETKHESLQQEVTEWKKNTKENVEAAFQKIRNCKTESDTIIKNRVDAANNKQNLTLISKSVGIATAICGFVGFILKLAGVL